VPRALGDEKECSTCGQLLSLRLFHKNRTRPDGLHNQCKSCVSASNARWRAANPDKKKAQGKKYKYDLEPDAFLRRQGVRLTWDEYNDLLAMQNGVCAICLQPETCGPNGKPRRLAIDHCHETKAVRGLLCMTCNMVLGQFRDSVERFEAAIRYLAR
jgi:hypothetical protein